MNTNDCPKASVHPVRGALRNVKLLKLVNLRSAFNTKNLILSYQCPSANSSLARAAVYEVIDAIISMFSQQIRSSLIQPLVHRILCRLRGSPTEIRQDLLKRPCLVSLILWLKSAVVFSIEGYVRTAIGVAFAITPQVKKRSSMSLSYSRQETIVYIKVRLTRTGCTKGTASKGY